MTRLPPRNPAWIPAKYDLPVVEAIRAVAKGEAMPDQQGLAVNWIVKLAAGVYDMSFRSDADGGALETAFAEGRRSVGLQVMALINMPPAEVAKMRNPHA